MREVCRVENIPSNTQLRDIIDTHGNKEVSGIFKDFSGKFFCIIFNSDRELSLKLSLD